MKTRDMVMEVVGEIERIEVTMGELRRGGDANEMLEALDDNLSLKQLRWAFLVLTHQGHLFQKTKGATCQRKQAFYLAQSF
eukprot:m.57639 g.57639  ORF g.57639 m.57639 type:complete len:81 (-) comp7832_c6_seq1:727-969(-)